MVMIVTFITPNDLNDLIRDPGLSKIESQSLAFLIEERNLVTPDTNYSVYATKKIYTLSFLKRMIILFNGLNAI